MPVRRPYYGLHQIITGKYTPGGEYVLDTGEDYVGSYHGLPNGQVFTESRPHQNSLELFEKRADLSDVVRTYNNILGLKMQQYESPVATQPMPTLSDYERGTIQRFFVQKRNNPVRTIVEIDSIQYNVVNSTNSPGINGGIWNKLLLQWKVSLIPIDDAALLNRRELIRAERTFPGIGIYLSNPVEFYR